MSSVLNYFTTYHTSRAAKEKIVQTLGWSNTLNPEDREISEYFNVRDLLLSEKGHGEYVDQIRDFKINFDLEIATYSLPGTDEKYAVDLKKITDSGVIASLNFLKDTAKAKLGGSDTGTVWSEKSKGNLGGKAGLQKKNEALRALQLPIEQGGRELLASILKDVPVAEDRKNIVRRHQFAEFTLKKLKEQIDKKVEVKNTEHTQLYAQPRTTEQQRRITELERENQELIKVKNKLNEIDTYALTMLIAIHPVGTHWHGDIEKSSNFIRKLATKNILKKRNDQKKRFWSKDATELKREESAYIDDMIGMLHKGRAEYIIYCKQNKIQFKKEGIEDLLLREAIKFADGEEYTAEGFKDAIHFDSLPEEVKKELDALFDDVALMATEAIPADSGEYPVEVGYPDKASDREKEKLDKQREDAIKTEIDVQREKINWELKEPTRRLITPNRLIAAAGAGALVAGGMHTGVIPPGTFQRALNFAWERRGNIFPLMIGGFALRNIVSTVIPTRRAARNLALGALITAGTAGTMIYVQVLNPSMMQDIYQMAVNNPAQTVALLSTAQATVGLTRDYIFPYERETSSELGSVPRRRLQKRRLAILLGSLAGASAAAYMYSTYMDDDDRERITELSETASGYGSAVADYAWNHYMITGLAGALTQIAGQYVAPRMPQAVRSVAGATHSVVTNVARMAQLNQLAQLGYQMLPNISLGNLANWGSSTANSTALVPVGGTDLMTFNRVLRLAASSSGHSPYPLLPR